MDRSIAESREIISLYFIKIHNAKNWNFHIRNILNPTGHVMNHQQFNSQ